MGSLWVIVHRAGNLRNADWLGKSDPCCVVKSTGWAENRVVTRVIMDTQEPIWDHVQQMIGYGEGDGLDVTVWDDDGGDDPEQGDLLGKILIQADQFWPNGMKTKTFSWTMLAKRM